VSLSVAMATAVCMMGCAVAGASSGGALGGASAAFGNNDDRRLVGGYTTVRLVTTSRRYVYAATTGGIAIYDRVFGVWLPPLAQDGGLSDAQITTMAGDPVEDAVWIGVPGAVIVYRPQTEQVQRTALAGVPDLIAFSTTIGGDALVRASGQWNRVTRAGFASPVGAPPSARELVVPRTLADVYARYPGLRTSAPLLFRNQQPDRALRVYPVESGTISLDAPSEVWLGTAGDGLYKVDGITQQATPLRFGLMDRGAAAVSLSADGVWIAGTGASVLRNGLTFASNDLQRWRWIDGTITVPLVGIRAGALAVRAQRAWIATDRGLVRVRLGTDEHIARWTSLDGMPDDRVLSLAARADGVWAGTARGLVFVTDSSDARNPRTRGIADRVLDNVPVLALQSVGDTLWIGTTEGLFALPAGGALARPAAADPALRRRIAALAWSDSTLVVATDNGVMRLAPRGGAEPERIAALNIALVGQVTKLAIDERTIVVTGTDGVLLMQRNGGVRLLRIPSDVPAPALDVAMSREWIWLATPVGVVRLRRASDGGVP
jgi:ligand-binding sensor domain-containing protein